MFEIPDEYCIPPGTKQNSAEEQGYIDRAIAFLKPIVNSDFFKTTASILDTTSAAFAVASFIMKSQDPNAEKRVLEQIGDYQARILENTAKLLDAVNKIQERIDQIEAARIKENITEHLATIKSAFIDDLVEIAGLTYRERKDKFQRALEKASSPLEFLSDMGHYKYAYAHAFGFAASFYHKILFMQFDSVLMGNNAIITQYTANIRNMREAKESIENTIRNRLKNKYQKIDTEFQFEAYFPPPGSISTIDHNYLVGGYRLDDQFVPIYRTPIPVPSTTALANDNEKAEIEKATKLAQDAFDAKMHQLLYDEARINVLEQYFTSWENELNIFADARIQHRFRLVDNYAQAHPPYQSGFPIFTEQDSSTIDVVFQTQGSTWVPIPENELINERLGDNPDIINKLVAERMIATSRWAKDHATVCTAFPNFQPMADGQKSYGARLIKLDIVAWDDIAEDELEDVVETNTTYGRIERMNKWLKIKQEHGSDEDKLKYQQYAGVLPNFEEELKHHRKVFGAFFYKKPTNELKAIPISDLLPYPK